MTRPQPPQQYLPPQHVPYYEGPPAETFQPQPPAPVTPRSRAPFIAGGVAVVAALSVGAALIVARPWQHDRTPPAVTPVAQVSPSAASHEAPTVPTVPSGPTLDHAAVEKFLVDLEDATTPVCNGAKDVAAKVGTTFTCVEGAQKWTVRITEVETSGGVRYELVD